MSLSAKQDPFPPGSLNSFYLVPGELHDAKWCSITGTAESV